MKWFACKQGLRMRAEELLLDAALVYVKRLLADVPRMRVWNDRSKTPAHLPSFRSECHFSFLALLC